MKSARRCATTAVVATMGATALWATAGTAAENPVQIENKRPVDPTVDDFRDRLEKVAPDGILDVYPSQWSVKNGDALGLRISSGAAKYRTRIYRIGWYPNGPEGPVGSRLVFDIGATLGQKQALPDPDPDTGLAECKWKDSISFTIPDNWVTGLYFVGVTNDTGEQAFTHFVVRDDTRAKKAPLLFMDPMANAVAYNAWPRAFSGGKLIRGKSIYKEIAGGPKVTASGFSNAVEVSSDRPLGEELDIVDYEIPMVQWLEKRGYDVAYANSYDVDKGDVLVGRKAWMDNGHDEYWSAGMWDSLVKARDNGTNLAFFSGNDMLWQVRFKPGSQGPYSTLVGYKDSAYPDRSYCGSCADWGGDPEFQAALAAKKAGKTDEQVAHLKRVTYRWLYLSDFDMEREVRVAAPEVVSRNPLSFEGLRDAAISTLSCTRMAPLDSNCWGVSWVVENASHWIYTGLGVKGGVATALRDGDHLPHVVGYEMDTADVGTTYSARPKTQLILASTDEGRFAGLFNAQIYDVPSGAFVFAAGTIHWAWGLDRGAFNQWGESRNKGDYFVQRDGVKTTMPLRAAVTGITTNVLNRMVDEAATGIDLDGGVRPDDSGVIFDSGAIDDGGSDATFGDAGPDAASDGGVDGPGPASDATPPQPPSVSVGNGGCGCRVGAGASPFERYAAFGLAAAVAARAAQRARRRR